MMESPYDVAHAVFPSPRFLFLQGSRRGARPQIFLNSLTTIKRASAGLNELDQLNSIPTEK